MIKRQYVIRREIEELKDNPTVLLLKNHTVFVEPSANIEQKYPGGRWRMSAVETGGMGKEGHGCAFVYCGPTGQALPMAGLAYGNEHARFISDDIVQVFASFKRGESVVTLTRFTIDQRGQQRTDPMYGFKLLAEHNANDTVPAHLVGFLPAIEAAIAKSQCRKCREAHFVKSGSEVKAS